MVFCKDCGNGTRCMCSSEIKFDTEGALCDILTFIENEPQLYLYFASVIDPKTIKWWKSHEKREENKIKKEALLKLTPRERKLLGL